MIERVDLRVACIHQPRSHLRLHHQLGKLTRTDRRSFLGMPSSNGDANGSGERDLEANANGSKPKPDIRNARQFRDIANLAVRNDFHHKLKKQLKEGSDGYQLEKFRKSVNDIKGIKNKQVRSFYEAQNERLNDWLEVDMLVNAMADDVLDSMNTQDTDGDGAPEVGGKLKSTKGDIAPLLPDDERERRRQGERRAKWAINVSGPSRFSVSTR